MSRSVLPSRRQAEILRQLEQSGTVTVSELASRFRVAGETIRRDFDKLARGGRLLRTHGGAVAPGTPGVEPSLAERSGHRVDEKRVIAEVAAQRLLSDEFLAREPVVALDASSTALEFARRLPNRTMTVISNGIDALRELADRPRIRAVATGGEFEPRGACFVGPLAESSLRQFAVDLACISCRGVDADRGCSEVSLAQASFKRQLSDAAECKVLLVDQSKINRKSVAYFCALADVDLVATTADPATARYHWLAEAPCQVAVAAVACETPNS